MIIFELLFFLACILAGGAVQILSNKRVKNELQKVQKKEPIQGDDTHQSLIPETSAVNDETIEEFSVHRDARLLREYKEIMLSTHEDKFRHLDAWSVKVLRGTRFVPRTEPVD